MRRSGSQNTYNLRNNTTDLTLLKSKREFLKRTFKYSGATLWNQLSHEAKTADSLYMFKNYIRPYYASFPSSNIHLYSTCML